MNGETTSALRQFNFFDLQRVHDVADADESPAVFQGNKTNEISCTCTGQASILIADIHGAVHLISAPDFAITTSWIAHHQGRVTHAAFSAHKRGVIVTLGEESASPYPILNVWSLAPPERKKSQTVSSISNTPRLLASGKLQSSNSPHPVSTFAITSSLSHVAVGLADGTVLLLRYLDQTVASALSAAPNSAPASLPKPRVLNQSSLEPVTGLQFASSTAARGVLYVVTTNKVLSYQASGKGSATIVDDIGAAVGCTALTAEGKLVIGRNEAIYVYGQDGREGCYAYEGNKSAIHVFGNYLVVVSPPFFPSAASNSATVRNFVAKHNADANSNATDISRVGIFDSRHKFVAHSSAFKEGVREVFVVWNRVWVLCNDGQLTRLEELPTSAKLDILFSKSLYLLALGLAETSNCDEHEISEIHLRYADHLYSKSDFEGAMSQYLQTIGHTEASYVIRKFLDAQRIHNLTSYLEALHTGGLANSAHTSLLINCYTKLKDTDRLDAFIKKSTENISNSSPDGVEGSISQPSTSQQQPQFDLETVIRVTRQAGYFDHAAHLARKYGEHAEYLQIQVEDRKDWREALQYIRGLGYELAEAEMLRYGKTLVDNLPKEATQLLIDLCCGTLDQTPPIDFDDAQQTRSPDTTGPSYFSYLSYGNKKTSAPTAQTNNTSSSPAVLSPPLSSAHQAQKRKSTSIPQPSSTLASDVPTRPPNLPAPKQFFAQFIGREEEFIHFLETVAHQRWDGSNSKDEEPQQMAVWNTLLELYLTLAAKSAEKNRQAELEFKALSLLRRSDPIPYNPHQALIVCTMARFEEGILVLYERLDMIEEILRRRIASVEPQQVFETLWKYGERAPDLYPIALRWISSDAALLSKHQPQFDRILREVEKHQILKPIQVLRILSRNNAASIGSLKGYFKSGLQADKSEIDSDRALVATYRKETAIKHKEVETLMDVNTPRVFQITRCSACGGNLDLPSVHFMCKHSYHQRCLTDSEAQDCPNCAREHGLVKEIRRNNEKLASQPDLFMQDVREEGFGAIASAFSKGWLQLARPSQD